MDPKHSTEMLKHLEKQYELLMDVHRSMSHGLHTLQVEEEMLMRKYYEFMAAQGLVNKNSGVEVEEGEENEQGGALADMAGPESS